MTKQVDDLPSILYLLDPRSSSFTFALIFYFTSAVLLEDKANPRDQYPNLSMNFHTALFAIATAASIDAFSINSSFTRRGVPIVAPITTATASTRRASSTALSMNLFDRFTRVAKSNINNVLKSLEDPEKIMNQAVEDMQNDLVKVRQSYAEITATQRRLMKQKEQADALADDWYKRAQLALSKGEEGLAKEALTRRQQQVETAEGLRIQIDMQAAAVDKLYEGMQALEAKILESKAKKEQMIARARTAQSTQKVNDMLGGITGKTSMDAFTRMEEKVEALEAAAEVSAEMGSLSGNALPGSSASSVEAQFKLLEASSSVDKELEDMKKMLGTTSSATKKSDVDDELERLKREAGL
jgi:phage shock protein A